MHDTLHRLYKTRLTLLGVLLIFIGLGLMVLAKWSANLPHWSWMNHLPVGDVGVGMFTTGLLAVAWQYFAQKVADDQTQERFGRAIDVKIPALRDAVIEGFAFTPEDLARVASPATIDQIARNALGLRLGDRELAAEIYADLRQQVIQSPVRQYDYIIAVDLAPWQSPDMFTATIHYEYRVTPANGTMRFSSVSDQETYEELLRDPTSALVWKFRPTGDLHGGSDDAFKLVQFKVNGKPLPIRRTRQARGQSYVVNLPDRGREQADAAAATATQEVTIAYTYQVLVRRHGHLLYLDIGRPTRGLRVAFRYGGCGISGVTPLDFIASATAARITETPTPSIEMAFDGWVLPKSGVAFVWTLDTEFEE